MRPAFIRQASIEFETRLPKTKFLKFWNFEIEEKLKFEQNGTENHEIRKNDF